MSGAKGGTKRRGEVEDVIFIKSVSRSESKHLGAAAFFRKERYIKGESSAFFMPGREETADFSTNKEIKDVQGQNFSARGSNEARGGAYTVCQAKIYGPRAARGRFPSSLREGRGGTRGCLLRLRYGGI